MRSSSPSASPASTEPSGGWDINIVGRPHPDRRGEQHHVEAAYYTDICGIPLKADGTGAINVDRTEDLPLALQVGNGSHVLPGRHRDRAGLPEPARRPGGRRARHRAEGRPGVRRRRDRHPEFRVNTRATAVAGYLQGYCDASEGKYCALLPVAFPVNIIACDGSNKPIDTGEPWTFNIVYKIPLCNRAPGQRRLPRLGPPARRRRRGRVLDP